MVSVGLEDGEQMEKEKTGLRRQAQKILKPPERDGEEDKFLL